ncbi:hypothetical protein DSO57_1034566 [Entomophthora muscae]|uniref:Uncharacterized protein n=1 Tax=Entomophthora muscae TaxID=34485 RepID=A0ACC2S1V1_9FUNG|nr:hypothetical protein DSO57_1034566 [Entomophthora muscae]
MIFNHLREASKGMKSLLLFAHISIALDISPTLEFQQNDVFNDESTFSLWDGQKELASCTADDLVASCKKEDTAFHFSNNRTFAHIPNLLCLYTLVEMKKNVHSFAYTSYDYSSELEWCLELSTNSYTFNYALNLQHTIKRANRNRRPATQIQDTEITLATEEKKQQPKQSNSANKKQQPKQSTSANQKTQPKKRQKNKRS